ncbi:MAG: hypothetical protein WC975_13330 [Phycisphaerae bacterium]
MATKENIAKFLTTATPEETAKLEKLSVEQKAQLPERKTVNYYRILGITMLTKRQRQARSQTTDSCFSFRDKTIGKLLVHFIKNSDKLKSDDAKANYLGISVDAYHAAIAGLESLGHIQKVSVTEAIKAGVYKLIG